MATRIWWRAYLFVSLVTAIPTLTYQIKQNGTKNKEKDGVCRFQCIGGRAILHAQPSGISFLYHGYL